MHFQDFGTPPHFSCGNKHQCSFKTSPLKTETRLPAPGGLAGSPDLCPGFSRAEAPRGRAASGHCPGPALLPAGRAGGRGLHNRGEGTCVRAESGTGTGTEGRERAAGAGEGARAAPALRTVRAPARTDSAGASVPALPAPPAATDGDGRPAKRGRCSFPAPALTPPPPHPALLLRRHLQPPPAQHLSNAPAHWATPPARSRAGIGRFPLCFSFPPAPQPEPAAPFLVRGRPRWAAAGELRAAAAREGGRAAAPRRPCPHQASRKGRNGSSPEPAWLARTSRSGRSRAGFRFRVAGAS